MKSRSFLYLLAFAASIMAVGLACAALSPSPTAVPTSVPATEQVAPPTTDNSGTTSNTNSGSDLVTFTDQNKYYEIDLPSEWNHTSGTDTNMYWDTFTAPDKNALVENIAYDDGTPWTGGSNGKGALYLLNYLYSYTKKEGDIRISDDNIQKDGSERLTWTSKGGGYSGLSYFEVRNKTTFLMFTVEWSNDYESTYKDVLNNVVSSYRVP
jgi:hypothetical protein